LALASFGTALYVAAYRTAYTEIDNELAGAARVFAGLGVRDSHGLPSSPNRLEGEQLAMASPRAMDDPSAVVSDAAPLIGAIGPVDVRQAEGDKGALDALKEVPQDCLRRLGWDESEQPYFIVWGSDGSVVRESTSCPAVPAAKATRTVANMSTDPPSVVPQFRQRGDVREVIVGGPGGSTILVGRSIGREQAGLANLGWSLMAVGAMVMAVGLLGGCALAQRVLRPIRRISETARSISASDLSRRIEGPEIKSEIGSLAQTLNNTFDRLESAFRRQAQFTADASHELRTPLAIICAGSELALARERSPLEYRQAIESSLRASKRMRELVESLLVLARADADALELNYGRFDLRQAVDDCLALMSPMAQRRNVNLEAQGAGVRIDADRDQIVRLITNLIGNAIQYNREGGTVRVAVVEDGGQAVLEVIDTGMGIAREDQPRIFQRFFRADKARSRESGGCGLGLAICKSIAVAHGGDISFGSVPGAGTTFVVWLPIVRQTVNSVVGCGTSSSSR
jgi:heavy metal sensor kinase